MTEVKFQEGKDAFETFMFKSVINAAGVAATALEDAGLAVVNYEEQEVVREHLWTAERALVVLSQLKFLLVD